MTECGGCELHVMQERATRDVILRVFACVALYLDTIRNNSNKTNARVNFFDVV